MERLPRRGVGPVARIVAQQADVAQLVEHHLAKVRVAGSNPVVRSRESPGSGGARGRNRPLVARLGAARTTFAPHFSKFFGVSGAFIRLNALPLPSPSIYWSLERAIVRSIGRS